MAQHTLTSERTPELTEEHPAADPGARAPAEAPRPTPSALAPAPASGLQQTLAILSKDLRAELRNRAAVNAILLFSVTSLVVVGFAVGTGVVSVTVKAALLWIVLFFAAFSGLAHVFLHEEETSTSTALRLCASPGAVFAGKLAFNLLLLGVIALVVVPMFVVMLDVRLEHPLVFLAVLVSGCAGVGAAATIIAAIIARARGKGALYGALGFPILLPLLIMAVSATRSALEPDTSSRMLMQGIGGLTSFAVMLITASSLLFPYVWEE